MLIDKSAKFDAMMIIVSVSQEHRIYHLGHKLQVRKYYKRTSCDSIKKLKKLIPKEYGNPLKCNKCKSENMDVIHSWQSNRSHQAKCYDCHNIDVIIT